VAVKYVTLSTITLTLTLYFHLKSQNVFFTAWAICHWKWHLKKKIIVEKIDYENIIGIEKIGDEGKIFKLHIIEDNPFPDHKLTTEEITITSEDASFEQIQRLIADKIHKGILQTNINKSNLIYFYRLVSVNGSINILTFCFTSKKETLILINNY